MPIFRLLPPFQEETNLLLSTNQGRESSGLSNIKTPPGSALLKDAVHVDGLSNTPERLDS